MTQDNTDERRDASRLHEAVAAALDAVSRVGRLEDSARHELEATLSTLDERLGSEPTRSHFNVQPVAGQCVVVADGGAPVACEVVASFMDGARAERLSSKAWLLPLGDLPPTRWARALRRVIGAERQTHADPTGALPFRLSMVWCHDGQLVMARVE